MRIVCPNCDTAYDVPATVVSAGRQMRCAKCRSEWTPMAPQDDAAVPPPAPDPQPMPAPEPDQAEAPASGQPEEDLRPKPMQRLPVPDFLPLLAAEPVIRAPFPDVAPAPPKLRRAVVAGWVASVLVLVLAFWLAIAFRQAVMQHWPASQRAYAALGFV